jgi:mannosyltransferase OCH1-like enzyme
MEKNYDFVPHIHQIWLQGEDNIPEKFKSNITQIKNLHPTWQYTLWDDIQIIQLLRGMNSKSLFKVENNKNPSSLIDIYYKMEHLHQKVDFARYVILYQFGGAYVDMDAKSIKPMDDLVEQSTNYEMLVSQLNLSTVENYITTGYKYSINNGVIIAKRKSSVLKSLIQKIINDYHCDIWSRKIKPICINQTTGPKRFTQTIFENFSQYPIKILSHQYFEPCVFEDCDITENTYFIHQHERSWLSASLNKNLSDFYKNRYIILLIILLFSISIYTLWKN